MGRRDSVFGPGRVDGRPVYCRMIHAHDIAAYCCLPRPCLLRYMVYFNRLVRYCGNGISARAEVVAHIGLAVYIVIAHYLSAGNVCAVAARPAPVMISIMIVQVLGAYEYPPTVGARVVKSAAGAERRPAAIATTETPAYPGRGPLITGYPYPAVVGIIGPAAVVISGPAPGFGRHPGIAIIGHYPVAIAAIGAEVATFIWHPNVTILGI